MPLFSIENFGCRATEADAAALRHALQAEGWERVAEHQDAELIVLNTCTVTAAADSQARDAVRKIHKANPNARIIVTGCYAQRAPEEIAQLEGISLVVGNAQQNEIPAIVRPWRSAQTEANATAAGRNFIPLENFVAHGISVDERRAPILNGDIFAATTVQSGASDSVGSDNTRPILKIQDGCNNRCAYCIIPAVRGRSRSLPPETVIAAVKQHILAGAREVVLSGINLGSYGRDLAPRVPLAVIVKRILNETPLEHLRLSSIEPQHVTDDFAALIASSPRIALHFHIPLQSGSDRILRAMHRWYRTAHYAARVHRLRDTLRDASIGADVIAGFPGETQADFEETVSFVREMPFSYLHVFSFSARPGTEAASLNGAPAPAVIRDRARTLRAISAEKVAAFRGSQSGKLFRGLTLARSGDGWTEALTTNYLKVRVAGNLPPNQWRLVRPTTHPDDVLLPFA